MNARKIIEGVMDEMCEGYEKLAPDAIIAALAAAGLKIIDIGSVNKGLKENSRDAIGVLDMLTANGNLRDYDDELANRVEDAKDIVRSWRAMVEAATDE